LGAFLERDSGLSTKN